MSEEHEPILEAIRNLRIDMREGFESIGKRMDRLEQDLSQNIKDVATLTERTRAMDESIKEERDRSRKNAGDLYEKDRQIVAQVSALEKRVYVLTVVIITVLEGGGKLIGKLL